MLLILSPSQTLDFDTPLAELAASRPPFLEDAAVLMNRLQQLSQAELAELMSLSDSLAELNHGRHQSWTASAHTPPAGRPAVLAFTGTVYKGLDAPSLSAADLTYAQEHVRILSGLYGVLRPLDLILPYRLELKIPLTNPAGDSLYDFWQEKITPQLNEALAEQRGEKILVNLASNEYARAVDIKRLNGRFVDIAFKDKHPDKERYRTIAVYAKEMRGVLARHIIQNRVEDLAALRRFAADGYTLNQALSSNRSLVYTRS